MYISTPPLPAAIDNPGHGTLFAQQLGDCHSEDCVVKHYATVLNITTTKYPSELGDLFGFDRLARQNPDFKMHLFGHSSEGANRWDFHPPPSWEAKTVNLRGFGFDGRRVHVGIWIMYRNLVSIRSQFPCTASTQ